MDADFLDALSASLNKTVENIMRNLMASRSSFAHNKDATKNIREKKDF